MLALALAMSHSIKDLVRRDLYRWICANAEPGEGLPSDVPDAFWVNPVAPTEPLYKEIVAFESEQLRCTQVVLHRRTDAEKQRYFLLKIAGRFVCVLIGSKYGSDGLDERSVFAREELCFLQILLLLRTDPFSSSIPIPTRVAVEWLKGCFSEDVSHYFPRIVAFAFSAAGAPPEPQAFRPRLLVELVARSTHLADLTDELVELILYMPSEGHDWLYDELCEAILANSSASSFLLLYRMLEFFFPLFDIRSFEKEVKSQIGSLDLVRACIHGLGLRLGHSASVRKYASVTPARRFRTKLPVAVVDGEPIEKWAERLVGVRNRLAHQGFGKSSHEDEASDSIPRIIGLLTDAFEWYRDW